MSCHVFTRHCTFFITWYKTTMLLCPPISCLTLLNQFLPCHACTCMCTSDDTVTRGEHQHSLHEWNKRKVFVGATFLSQNVSGGVYVCVSGAPRFIGTACTVLKRKAVLWYSTHTGCSRWVVKLVLYSFMDHTSEVPRCK